MSRQSNKEWSRQMMERIRAAEVESGLTWEERRQRKVAENFSALRRLAIPLAAAGVTITEQAHYLPRGSPEHIKALPVFFSELDGDYPEDIKMYMLQHLCQPEAACFRPALVKALRSSTQKSAQFQFQLAVTIDALSSPNDLEEIITLITDRSLGMSRIAFVQRLARSRSARAIATLEELRDDPDLHKEVAAKFEGKARYRTKKAKRNAA